MRSAFLETAALALALLGGPLLWACPTTSDPPASEDEAPAPTGQLSVTLVDADDAALEGGFVTVGPLGIGGTSGPDGEVSLGSILPGTYRVTAAASGFETTVVEGVGVVAGETTELAVALDVDGASLLPALRVQARTAAGNPLAGATVSVDGGAFEATTGGDGSAALGGLPTGDVLVQILPSGDAIGAPWSAELRFEEGASTLLTVTLSGVPGPNATFVGSEACLDCHADDHAAWTASAHGRTWAPSGPAELETLIDAGLTAPIALPYTPQPVQVRLARSGGVTRATLYAASGSATFDVLGWYGANAHVPLLDLPSGPAPGPVIWRPEGVGDMASPAFASGLVGFRPEAWFTPGGGFVSHDDTDGPAPADLEAAGCLGCHATGVEINELGGVVSATALTERGVGCESCHGPGSEHAAAGNDEDGGVERVVNPGRMDPDTAMDVCAACHSGGLAAASTAFEVDVPFPYADHDPWRPGEPLTDFFVSAPDLWPGGAAAGPNQQVDELRSGPHGGSGLYALGCGECHAAHGPSGDAPHQLLDAPDDNGLCLGCHLALHFEDEAGAVAHTRHSGYDPTGPYASGRCTGCHMPATASRDGRSALTGGGRLSSHRFAITSPAVSLAAFDAVGNQGLPLEDVPPNACLTCHRWAEIRYDAVGVDFHGPAGEPTLRTTYVTLTAVFDWLFGGSQ